MIQALQDISPVTRALSGYIAEALGRALPEDVAEKARHHILDTLAAMISGTHLYPGKMALAYIATLGGTKEATVIGSRIRT